MLSRLGRYFYTGASESENARSVANEAEAFDNSLETVVQGYDTFHSEADWSNDLKTSVASEGRGLEMQLIEKSGKSETETTTGEISESQTATGLDVHTAPDLSEENDRGTNTDSQMDVKKAFLKEASNSQNMDDASAEKGAPDTTSFAGFILSLFSISQLEETESETDSEVSLEADNRALDSSENQESTSAAASTSFYDWTRLGFTSSAQKPPVLDEAVKSASETAASEGENPSSSSSYLRWLGFYRKPAVSLITDDKAFHAASESSHDFRSADNSPLVRDSEQNSEFKLPTTPRSPLKLPAMSEESFLLTEDNRMTIYTVLPALARGREWVLLYSTIKHGISLLTLYRRSGIASGPCLLVIEDYGGAIFGGLSSGPLKPSSTKKYQGSSECFVFSDASGEMTVFKASGANRYFLLCMNDALALGGGGHFAIQIEGELLRGTSGACETFNSPCLAKKEEFKIRHIELWGFAHNSRYTPKDAHWHEPEQAPGIHTW